MKTIENFTRNERRVWLKEQKERYEKNPAAVIARIGTKIKEPTKEEAFIDVMWGVGRDATFRNAGWKYFRDHELIDFAWIDRYRDSYGYQFYQCYCGINFKTGILVKSQKVKFDLVRKHPVTGEDEGILNVQQHGVVNRLPPSVYGLENYGDPVADWPLPETFDDYLGSVEICTICGDITRLKECNSVDEIILNEGKYPSVRYGGDMVCLVQTKEGVEKIITEVLTNRVASYNPIPACETCQLWSLDQTRSLLAFGDVEPPIIPYDKRGNRGGSKYEQMLEDIADPYIEEREAQRKAAEEKWEAEYEKRKRDYFASLEIYGRSCKKEFTNYENEMWGVLHATGQLKGSEENDSNKQNANKKRR